MLQNRALGLLGAMLAPRQAHVEKMFYFDHPPAPQRDPFGRLSVPFPLWGVLGTLKWWSLEVRFDITFLINV